MGQIQVYLSDILHIVAQWLLAPDIILLLAFIGYALFCIGSLLVELFTERKHFKVVMPKFLNALMEADEKDVPLVVEDSGLLKRQKQALMTVYDNRNLPGDALMALVKREVEQEESRYNSITGRNNTAARVAPMLGLMGTLIPLGPGIEALGRADTAALSSSLLVAFDTTVAGLVVAAVCLVIGKIRGNWYDDYLSALDASMATMLEKIDGMKVGERKVVLFVDGQEYELAPSAGAAATSTAPAAAQPIAHAAEEPQAATQQVEASSSEAVLPSIESFIGREPAAAPQEQPEPVLETAKESEQAPEIVLDSVFESASASAVEQVIEPAPATEPVVASEPAPAVEQVPEPEPAPEPAPESVAASEPTPEPEPEPASEPLPEPVSMPEPEPVVPAAEPAPAIDTVPRELVIEPVSMPEPEPVVPAAEPSIAEAAAAAHPSLEELLSQEAVPVQATQPVQETAPAQEAQPASVPESANTNAGVQPVIEPKAPISLIFEPVKDPLSDDAGSRL